MNDKELFTMFAAHAMQGMLANPESDFTPLKNESNYGVTWADKVAAKAFEVSAAMIRRYKRSI